MFRILLIEDDESLFKEIQERLTSWSYTIDGVQDFSNVMEEFQTLKPDMVLIDIQLPKFDGFHWCRLIRHHSTVPIVFLSSRDHPMDMVMSMQLGADDFIQKPFHFDVLVAKIQAVLRRTYSYTSQPMSIRSWNGVTIDLEKNKIFTPQHTIDLTKNEIAILSILVDRQNTIVSRDELMNRLWDDHRFISDNTLTVNVNRLRKKLEEVGLGHAIETKVGQGYIATEKDETL